jgi:hypothetical protein
MLDRFPVDGQLVAIVVPIDGEYGKSCGSEHPCDPGVHEIAEEQHLVDLLLSHVLDAEVQVVIVLMDI